MDIVVDKTRDDLGGNRRNGDLDTWCPHLWEFLVHRFAVHSVLDVGCGEGHAVDYFRRLGIIAHGIDGLTQNIQRAVTPISLHDLLDGAFVMPVDLVWSCEVAEHIHPSKISFYLDTLANGRVIVMTHGLPGQPGHHHVNCQPQEYWTDRMQQRGYVLDPKNMFYRELSGRGPNRNFFAASGLVFLKDK